MIFNRDPGKPDLIKFLEDVRRCHMPEKYTQQAQRRDFQTTFETTEGKRVLFQILEWSGVYKTAPLDVNDLQRWAGAHDLGMLIMMAMHAETKDE